jgi:AraC-like DNA-binding protein
MENLNFVNLIQAGMTSVGILGGLLLWLTKSKEFRGISVLLFCIALAACISILEESGLTREIYLISPIFIMLFGPVIYLAAKLLIDKELATIQFWHLLPIIPLLFFTSYTDIVIGIGTVWRLAYALLTMSMLLTYKRLLDEERSDSDDFSLNWLVWLLAVTSIFNIIDLVRLNVQLSIPYDLNVFGQGINNAVWLIATMIIIIKLQLLKQMPKNIVHTHVEKTHDNSTDNSYDSIFQELDKLITSNQWFLKSRLTLSDISDLTGLQTRDISRSINVVTEKSFNEYINNYRVDFVCTLLGKSTKKSLSDIAADAGFSSKASFNKVFKQIAGVTPTEYKSRKEV